MGLVRYERLKSNRAMLEQEILQAKKDNDALKKQIDDLKKDPAYIEKLARENLGLARRDEIIFQYEGNGR